MVLQFMGVLMGMLVMYVYIAVSGYNFSMAFVMIDIPEGYYGLKSDHRTMTQL